MTDQNLVYGYGAQEPSVAEAPGPISPEHESRSWEQTLAEYGPPAELGQPSNPREAEQQA